MTKIGFSTTNMFLSKLIRKITGSKASHTFLIYQDETLAQTMVMEAAFEGFRVIPYKEFCKKNIIIQVIEPKVSLELGVKVLANSLGDYYDFKGLIGAGLVKIWKRFKRKIHNPWIAGNSMFCSESVVRALQISGYPGTEDMVASDVSPQDLLDFLES